METRQETKNEQARRPHRARSGGPRVSRSQIIRLYKIAGRYGPDDIEIVFPKGRAW
ncbi:MAG: hypothetical protein ACYCTE_14145 [Acidimicrobiales bacterium]